MPRDNEVYSGRSRLLHGLNTVVLMPVMADLAHTAAGVSHISYTRYGTKGQHLCDVVVLLPTKLFALDSHRL